MNSPGLCRIQQRLAFPSARAPAAPARSDVGTTA